MSFSPCRLYFPTYILILFVVVILLRLYLKYLRSLAEKTDLGRVAAPSILRLVDDALSLSGRGTILNGTTSSEIWDYLETLSEVIMFSCCSILAIRAISRY